MNNITLPASKETPSTLFELRDKLVDLESRVSDNHGKINTLENTIYNGGAKIEEIGNIIGWRGGPPSTKSVQDALSQINSDFTSSFRNTATVIGHINDNLFNTLEIVKFMIICMGQITYNQRKDKKASEKAVKRLKEVVKKVETGELNISELIDIFAENVESEAREYQLLEDKIASLSKEQLEFIAQFKIKIEELARSQNEFISQSNEQITNAIADIEKKYEALSKSLRDDQSSAISNLNKSIDDNITQINNKSDELTKSQEAFISESKEQSSKTLFLLKEEAKENAALIKANTDKFMENHETLYNDMKKQVKLYKIISVIAIISSIASVMYSILM